MSDIDLRIHKYEKKAIDPKKRKYFSCESSDLGKLDRIEEILSKYMDRFEAIGVKVYVRDRRVQ